MSDVKMVLDEPWSKWIHISIKWFQRPKSQFMTWIHFDEDSLCLGGQPWVELGLIWKGHLKDAAEKSGSLVGLEGEAS